MSSVVISGDTSGAITLAAPAVAGTNTLTLPAQTATVITDSSGVLNIGSGQFYKAASGNVGIGTISPAVKLDIQGAVGTSTSLLKLANTSGASASNIVQQQYFASNSFGGIEQIASITALNPNASGNNGGAIFFSTSANGTATTPTERMRIDSNGNLNIATTGLSVAVRLAVAYVGGGTQYGICLQPLTDNTTSIFFNNASGLGVGSISQTTVLTTYGTTSDYRLKENVAPMTGALDVVQALKPVTYKWKADGSDGQGFIAHELQAVVPDCVTGEKDAVDKDGKPQFQGIDTSFLVATLTAAIQEQQAMIEELKAGMQAQADQIAALIGANK